MEDNNGFGESTYPIDPNAPEEAARLIWQGALLTRLMGGTFPANRDLSQVETVLNIGSGPGAWDLQFGYEHPNIEVYGIDINSSMVEYASNQAQLQHLDNVHFEVMDAKQLSFPPLSFDLINIRLLVAALQPDDYPAFLARCFQLLRPGGTIRWTECDMGSTNSPAYEKYIRLFAQGMFNAGRSPSVDGYTMNILPIMSQFVHNAGFGKIEMDAIPIDGRAGTDVQQRGKKDIEYLFELLKPFIISTRVTTQAEINALYNDVLLQMEQDTFTSLTFILTVWATKI